MWIAIFVLLYLTPMLFCLIVAEWGLQTQDIRYKGYRIGISNKNMRFWREVDFTFGVVFAGGAFFPVANIILGLWFIFWVRGAMKRHDVTWAGLQADLLVQQNHTL